MSKVKITKKSSVLKTVGLVFMVITLLTALALTNNTVRQFITDSFAFDYECGAKGSPSARNQCQQRNDDNKRAAILNSKTTSYNNYANWLRGIQQSGGMTSDQLQKMLDKVHRIIFYK